LLPSATSATSRRKICSPAGVVFTTIAANSSAVEIWRGMVTV